MLRRLNRMRKGRARQKSKRCEISLTASGNTGYGLSHSVEDWDEAFSAHIRRKQLHAFGSPISIAFFHNALSETVEI